MKVRMLVLFFALARAAKVSKVSIVTRTLTEIRSSPVLGSRPIAHTLTAKLSPRAHYSVSIQAAPNMG